jgi:hypothetical protein
VHDREYAAHQGGLPGSRRSPCLACGRIVVTARDAHVTFGGKRDGSLLVVFGHDPQVSWATVAADALFAAEDLYLLGIAHTRCMDEARRRLEQQEVELPEELPQLLIDEPDDPPPAPHVPPTADRCAFCGSVETLTEEHVIPRWITRRLRELGGSFVRETQYGARRSPTIEITAPICEECNNRWLAVLENDVRQLLNPMLTGTEMRIHADQQLLLATWALKTALMFDLASGTPIVPEGFYHDLRLRRSPNRNHWVWLGLYGGQRSATKVVIYPLHLGIAETEPPNGFICTFSVFRVVLQVAMHFTRGTAELRDDRRQFEPVVERIWPRWITPVVWPKSTYAFFDDSFEQFAASFT